MMERGWRERGCSMEKEEETNVDVVFKRVKRETAARNFCIIILYNTFGHWSVSVSG